jgi:hypothetical protein
VSSTDEVLGACACAAESPEFVVVAAGVAAVGVAVEEAIEELEADPCICQAGIPGGLFSIFAKLLEGDIVPEVVEPAPLNPNLEDDEDGR